MRIAIMGANQGLGLVLSKLCAERGCTVYACHRGKPSAALSQAAQQCRHLAAIECDVTIEAQAEEAAARIEADGGKLDALVHIAGVLTDSDRTRLITEASIEDLRAALEVNVIGGAIVIKHFHALVQDGGMFVVVTSEAGSVTNNGAKYPGYSISKAAQNKLAAVFAQTVSRYTVLAVHPGRMNTVMGRNDAQIEPEESAEGIYKILAREKDVPPSAGWFINYKAEPMEI